MTEAEVAELWWHCYGGVTDDSCDWGGGNWCLIILGESTMHPEQLVAEGRLEISPGETKLRYIRSYTHDPSDAEKELLMPEEYRD